jgi:hypothetical protein
MSPETLVRLLGYSVEAAFTFLPVVLLSAVTWRLTR